MRRARSTLAIAAAAIASLAMTAAGCGPGVVWLGHSPDRQNSIFVIQDGSGQRVRLDGKDGKTYRAIGVEALVWSADGRHMAYPARVEGGWVVVADAAESPVWDGIGELVWSADGRHIAYAAEHRGRWVVVRDGKAGPPFEALRARSLKLSADGEHLAYAADDFGKVVSVVDGVKSAPYDAIGALAFGESGRAVFAARRGKEAFVVIDGKESAACEDVADVALSPDGQRVAWTARREGAWRVVVDGAEGEPFERISKVVWAQRGDRLAYVVGRGNAEMVVVNGVLGAAYQGVVPGSLTFDASGAHVAYAARRDGSYRAVVDEGESPPYEDMESPAFVGDSAAVAHLARRGAAAFLVVDGHIGPVFAEASQLVLSRDGRRFLHTARVGARMAVVEGVVSGAPCGEGRCSPEVTRTTPHDVVVGGTLVFGESGALAGYLAGDAWRRSLFLVIDGARAGGFDMDELMAGLAVDPDLAGALTGDSKRLQQWVRAEVTLAERRTRRAP